MKLAEIKGPTKEFSADLLIIYEMKEQNKWGKRIKTVVVVDKDAEQKPGRVSALLDLYDEDVDKYKVEDEIRAINCKADLKWTRNNTVQQPIIGPGYFKGTFIGRYEKP